MYSIITAEYVKLQDAYISETGVYIGKWNVIGYSMTTQTPSFDYAEGNASYDDQGTVALDATEKTLWTATARVALNDCTANSQWGLFGKRNAKGNGIDWKTGVKKGTAATAGANEADCSNLTPQFINLTRAD